MFNSLGQKSRWIWESYSTLHNGHRGLGFWALKLAPTGNIRVLHKKVNLASWVGIFWGRRYCCISKWIYCRWATFLWVLFILFNYLKDSFLISLFTNFLNIFLDIFCISLSLFLMLREFKFDWIVRDQSFLTGFKDWVL